MGVLVASLTGCIEIETFVPPGLAGGPAGVMTGQVVYFGKLPCTREARIEGVAVLGAYERSALPPPDGVGLSPAGLSVVTAETLFASVASRLRYHPDGRRWCPSPTDSPVTVSADWAISPLAAGEYQVRGFFDHDGDFNPAFSITRQATRGDVAGGAIANLPEASVGAPPIFESFLIGERDIYGQRVVDAAGQRIDGVTVHLALPLEEDRPRFFFESVTDSTYGNQDPEAIVVPSDYPVATFDPTDPVSTEASFIRVRLGAGMAPDERQSAEGSPFFFDAGAASFTVRRFDANRDGLIDERDHIPESSLLPSLAPLGLLTKRPAGEELLPARAPMVVMQAVTLFEGAASTAGLPSDFRVEQTQLLLALRPAVLCLDPSDSAAPVVLLLTRDSDGDGRPLIEDPQSLTAWLASQFGRPATVVVGCLPQGEYSTHLIQPTGQSWSVPNEAGICGPTEALSKDGRTCGRRPRLSSQAVSVRVGPPTDPVYCQAHPTPRACLP